MKNAFTPRQNNETASQVFAGLFGALLGLAVLKFGNPVILDQKISPPVSFSEFINFAWPLHWANWILWPLAIASAIFIFTGKFLWPATKWLWLLPLCWFGWQLLSAAHTVDADLTAATLWQFSGSLACYFVGAFLIKSERAFKFLLIGISIGFTLCLIRAVDQKTFEFPQSRQMLIEGEHSGWTNFPPDALAEMKRENAILTTNGIAMANPKILEKFSKGRVMGTLIYPNALAGAILLLFPVSLVMAFAAARQLRPMIQIIAFALILFLGIAAFYWTGSKLGWLIAITIGGISWLRLRWPAKLKIATFALVAVFGLGIFAIRFHNYFAAGATSVGARFDYWRAAIQTARKNPLFGTGPGTFQRPYAQLKSPEAEMARLAHNDYLEQFSDSGIAGGIFYVTWIVCAFVLVGRRVWKSNNRFVFSIFLGLSGWFLQGLGEFELYIPALSWTAFAFLGSALALTANPFDKKPKTVKIPPE